MGRYIIKTTMFSHRLLKNVLRDRFASDRCGTAVLEFALIAPLFFLTVMGTLELGLIFFTYSVLEGATSHGSRVGLTGYSVGQREGYIRNEITRLSGGYLDPSRISMEILSYRSFNNIGMPEDCISPPIAPCPGVPGVNFIDVNGNGQWDEDQGAENAGGANAIVLYRVTYRWPVFTPLMRNILGNSNGDYTVVAVSTVRNEAFP